jgi:lysozyme
MPDLPPELLALVKRMEGYRAEPYRCPAGYPTIGYGHRIPSTTHPPVTEAEAEALLRVDLGWAQRAALALAPNLATEPRRLAALTDLVYNVGRDALDGEHPNDLSDDAGVVRALRAGDWQEAADRFRRWNKARVRGQLVALPGLTARRAIGAHWIEEG